MAASCVREIIESVYILNEFTRVTMSRTKTGGIFFNFNSRDRYYKYGRKLFMSYSEVMCLIRELARCRQNLFDKEEKIVSEYSNKLIKYVIYDSPSRPQTPAVYIGMWWKKMADNILRTRFNFTLYTPEEIINFINLKDEFERRAKLIEDFDSMLEEIYVVLGEEIERLIKCSEDKTVESLLNDFVEDGLATLLRHRKAPEKHNYPNDIMRYIKTTCKEDFLNFYEANYGCGNSQD